MLTYLLAAVVLLLAYFLYKCVIVPTRLKKHYIKEFTNRGYKVKQLPLNPFGLPFYDNLFKMAELKGDPFYEIIRDKKSLL